ncbi:MAG TPA: hypothetical protein VEI48_06375 [Candidatus Sulfotelmatobacter sp.]|nr:hypothetical protein [Candidatus Sulfotelmatobacter sp.]
MARAKRTARADARRRYRAAQAPAADTEDDAPASRDVAQPAVSTGGGLLGMFGGVHLPDFRGDLLAMPDVVRTTRTLWAAFALGLVAVAAGLTFPLNDPGLTGLVLPLFIQAPGIPVLVGGFVAPRGAWLIGGVIGLLQALGLLAAIYRSTPGAIDGSEVLVALVSGAVLGTLFGGLAAWYRRWLRTMGARNAAAREERAKQQRRDAKRSARPAR